MNLIENLEKYTEYAQGNKLAKCKLEYADLELSNMDFSKYDLNNCYFGGVEFSLCNFTNVYLSGSNFGGSCLDKCILYKNALRKASWDDMTWRNMEVNQLDAFRTTFMYGKFCNINFINCCFQRCSFADSELIDITFTECKLIDTDFVECKLENVHFKSCKIENPQIDMTDENNHVVFE